jgi:hypothetical protein
MDLICNWMVHAPNISIATHYAKLAMDLTMTNVLTVMMIESWSVDNVFWNVFNMIFHSRKMRMVLVPTTVNATEPEDVQQVSVRNVPTWMPLILICLTPTIVLHVTLLARAAEAQAIQIVKTVMMAII